MEKPPTLPMPWIGGGGSAKAKACGTPCSAPIEAPEDRPDVLAWLFQTRVPILQDDEGDAGVGEAVARLSRIGYAADSHYVLDAGDLAGHPLDLLQHPIRSLL